MASVNRVILVGHLGADPESRSNPKGELATLRIATSDSYKDKHSGEKVENTEWHRCVCFGRLAEIARDYLKKGALVYIEGSIHTRSYDKDGETKYVVEIRVQNLQMLGGRGESRSGPSDRNDGYQRPAPRPSAARPATGGAGTQTGFDDMDDDIPFVSFMVNQTSHIDDLIPNIPQV